MKYPPTVMHGVTGRRDTRLRRRHVTPRRCRQRRLHPLSPRRLERDLVQERSCADGSARRRAAGSSQTPAKFAGGSAELEEYLDTKGVQYEFLGEVDVQRFDRAKSLKNQARVEPLDERRAEEYAEAMRLGAKFPPVIARGGRLVAGVRAGMIMVDGDHRLDREPPTLANTSSSPLLSQDRPRRRTAVGRPHAVVDAAVRKDAWAVSSQVAAGFLSGYPSSTANAYASDLRDLFTFAAGRDTAPLLLSRVDLHLYLRQLQEERRLAASTVRRRLAAVCQYYRWAVDEGVLAANPARRLRRPRSDAPPPKNSLTPAEMTALLHAAEAHSSRASVLVQLLLLHGCRIGEVLAADVVDVTGPTASRQLRLLAKGRVLRCLILLPATAELLDKMIDGRADGPLLLSRSGRRWHRTNAARLLRSIARSALDPAVADRLHPHALRRAFVDAGLDAGVGLSELQAALGHRTSSMVLVYASRYRADRMPVPHRVATSLQLGDHAATGIPG